MDAVAHGGRTSARDAHFAIPRVTIGYQFSPLKGEAPLRIDHCETCRGYVKTYDGEGHENLLLADWTSIHLDIIAQDRGLQRLAASLYGF